MQTSEKIEMKTHTLAEHQRRHQANAKCFISQSIRNKMKKTNRTAGDGLTRRRKKQVLKTMCKEQENFVIPQSLSAYMVYRRRTHLYNQRSKKAGNITTAITNAFLTLAMATYMSVPKHLKNREKNNRNVLSQSAATRTAFNILVCAMNNDSGYHGKVNEYMVHACF